MYEYNCFGLDHVQCQLLFGILLTWNTVTASSSFVGVHHLGFIACLSQSLRFLCWTCVFCLAEVHWEAGRGSLSLELLTQSHTCSRLAISCWKALVTDWLCLNSSIQDLQPLSDPPRLQLLVSSDPALSTSAAISFALSFPELITPRYPPAPPWATSTTTPAPLPQSL